MTTSLPILFSFRRCPYAMRARLALAVSGQTVALREVELKNRPPEIYAVSPKGTVPVLVLADGTVLEESIEIMHWTLARKDPLAWLGTSEARKNEIDALIQRCDGDFKHHLDRYKYANRYADVDAEEHRAKASEFLFHLQELLEQHTFLLAEQACLADMALAPFVRQFAFADRSWFDAQPWPQLRAWLDAFCASPLFARIMPKFEPWTPDAEPIEVSWA